MKLADYYKLIEEGERKLQEEVEAEITYYWDGKVKKMTANGKVIYEENDNNPL